MTATLFQICYDEATKAALMPGFLPLDNLSNARPDWREYWPIRQYLLANSLADSDRVGFFSPKFGQKTGLDAEAVQAFVTRRLVDVHVFSPYVEQSAFFLNVSEHGDANHPGLGQAMRDFCSLAGIQPAAVDPVALFNEIIFSNFFVATGRFWRRWLEIGELLFSACEDPTSALAHGMNKPARYLSTAGPVCMKVFVMERIASLILADGGFTSAAYDPFQLRRTGIKASYLDHEMRIAHALKAAYRTTQDSNYLRSYLLYRQEVMERLAV